MLARAAGGDDVAVRELAPLVYEKLRSLAGEFLRHERAGHTLQPTALVHEAYIKLVGSAAVDFNNRAHFFGIAARAMRQVLTDHARGYRAAKRGGAERKRLTLTGALTPAGLSQVDLLALDEALEKLAVVDPRQTRIVELRFLAGLGIEETGHVLGISAPTVKREWRMARAWLRSELDEEPRT